MKHFIISAVALLTLFFSSPSVKGQSPYFSPEDVARIRNSAEAGDPVAQTAMGFLCEEGWGGVPQSYSEAAKWYKKASAQGSAEAQLSLGYLYIQGKGVAKNDAEAFKLFKQAALQGVDKAQYNVGLCYKGGDGVEKNTKEAFNWFLKAAQKGLPDAQFEVAIAYLMGNGVAENETEGWKWFEKALEGGSEKARALLKELQGSN